MFGRKPKPLPNDRLRDMLFGDMSLDRWPAAGEGTSAFPWSAFVAARSNLRAGRPDEAIASWRKVLERPDVETRHHLQAWHFLRQAGEKPPGTTAKLVLGVVVELTLPAGLDVLATYIDHTARYYNYSGSGVIWEHADDSLDQRIDSLLAASADVVRQIGPWDGERPSSPQRGQTRLSFLTPSGLHFGQGPTEALPADPKAGVVLPLAALLMTDLLQRAKAV